MGTPVRDPSLSYSFKPGTPFGPDLTGLSVRRTQQRSGEDIVKSGTNSREKISPPHTPTASGGIWNRVMGIGIGFGAAVALATFGTTRLGKWYTAIDQKQYAENCAYIEKLPQGTLIKLAIAHLAEKIAANLAQLRGITASSTIQAMYKDKNSGFVQVIENALLTGIVNLFKKCPKRLDANGKAQPKSLADLVLLLMELIQKKGEEKGKAILAKIEEAESKFDDNAKTLAIAELFSPILTAAFPNKEADLGIDLQSSIPGLNTGQNLANAIWSALNNQALPLLFPYYKLVMELSVNRDRALNALFVGYKGHKYLSQILANVITNVVLSSCQADLATKISTLVIKGLLIPSNNVQPQSRLLQTPKTPANTLAVPTTPKVLTKTPATPFPNEQLPLDVSVPGITFEAYQKAVEGKVNIPKELHRLIYLYYSPNIVVEAEFEAESAIQQITSANHPHPVYYQLKSGMANRVEFLAREGLFHIAVLSDSHSKAKTASTFTPILSSIYTYLQHELLNLYQTFGEGIKEDYYNMSLLHPEDPTRTKWIEANFGGIAESLLQKSELITELSDRDPEEGFQLVSSVRQQFPYWMFEIFGVVFANEPALKVWIHPEKANQTDETELSSYKYSPMYKFVTEFVSKLIVDSLPEKFEQGMAETIADTILAKIILLVPEMDSARIQAQIELEYRQPIIDTAKIGQLHAEQKELTEGKKEFRASLVNEINRYGQLLKQREASVKSGDEPEKNLREFLLENVANILHKVFLRITPNVTPSDFIARCASKVCEEGTKLLKGPNGVEIADLFSDLTKTHEMIKRIALSITDNIVKQIDGSSELKFSDAIRQELRTSLINAINHFDYSVNHQTFTDFLIIQTVIKLYPGVSPSEALEKCPEALKKIVASSSDLSHIQASLEKTEYSLVIQSPLKKAPQQDAFKSRNALVKELTAFFLPLADIVMADLGLNTDEKLKIFGLNQANGAINTLFAASLVRIYSALIGPLTEANEIKNRICDMIASGYLPKSDSVAHPRRQFTSIGIEKHYKEQGISGKGEIVLKVSQRMSGFIVECLQGYVVDAKSAGAGSTVSLLEYSSGLILNSDAKSLFTEQVRSLAANGEDGVKTAWHYSRTTLSNTLLPKMGLAVAQNLQKQVAPEEYPLAKLPSKLLTKFIDIFGEFLSNFEKSQKGNPHNAKSLDCSQTVRELFHLIGNDVTNLEHPIASVPFLSEHQKKLIWDTTLPKMVTQFLEKSFDEMDKRSVADKAKASLEEIYASKILDSTVTSYGAKPFEEFAEIMNAFTRDILPVFMKDRTFLRTMLTNVLSIYFTTPVIKAKEARAKELEKISAKSSKAEAAAQSVHKNSKEEASNKVPPIPLDQNQFQALLEWLVDNIVSFANSGSQALDTLKKFLGHVASPLILEMMNGIAEVLKQIEVKEMGGKETHDTSFVVEQFVMFIKDLSQHITKVNEITRKTGYSQPYEVPDAIMFKEYGPDIHPSLAPVELNELELAFLKLEAERKLTEDPIAAKAYRAQGKAKRESDIKKLVDPEAEKIIKERQEKQEMDHFFIPLFEQLLILSGVKEDSMPVPAVLKPNMFHLLKINGPYLLKTVYNQATSSYSIDGMLLTVMKQMESTFKTLEEATLKSTETAPHLDASQKAKLVAEIKSNKLRNALKWALKDRITRAVFSDIEGVNQATDESLANGFNVVAGLTPMLAMLQKAIMTSATATHPGDFKPNGDYSGRTIINREYSSKHPDGIDVEGEKNIAANQVRFPEQTDENRERTAKWAESRRIKLGQDVISAGVSLTTKGFDRLVQTRFDHFCEGLKSCSRKTFRCIVFSESLASNITEVLSYAVWAISKVIGGIMFLPLRLLNMIIDWFNHRNVSVVPPNIKMRINGQMRGPLLRFVTSLANERLAMEARKSPSMLPLPTQGGSAGLPAVK